jgi:DNA polymerase-4
MSSERTLTTDLDQPAELRVHVRQAAAVVARRLRAKGQAARGVRLKLKTHDFRILTRQHQLAEATEATGVIEAATEALLAEIDDPGPFRLIGVAVFDIQAASGARRQLDLLAGESASRERLDAVLDALHRRFGPGSVRRAADLVGRTVFEDDVNLDGLREDERFGEDV